VIRWALLAAGLAILAEARAQWRRDRRLNGRSRPGSGQRLAPLIAVGRLAGRAGVRVPAPPGVMRRDVRRAGQPALADEAVDEARAGSVVLFGGIGLVALLLVGSALGLALALACAAFGWLYPDLWLRAAAARRAQLIEQQAPLVIDLIASLVSAGISLDEAIRCAATTVSGPLRLELEAVSANLALGNRRGAELRDLGERTASRSLMRLATALRISDRLGVPLAENLRRQAARARSEQARMVQERAARAAPRILLVVVFLLVPAAMLPVMTALALAATGSVGQFLAG
jgi:tight adherence protein C